MGNPQVFLEDCQYTVRKKVSRYNSDASKISFDDSDEEASDKSNESVFDKQASNKGERYYTRNIQKQDPDKSGLIF